MHSVVRLIRAWFFRYPGTVRGFSLVEVLIATTLLATAISGLAHLFALAIRANFDAGDTTWATVLAAQKIEELRAGPFPEPVDHAVDYLDSGGIRLDDPGAAPRVYTRRWWVEPLPSAPDTTMVITVAVSRYRRDVARLLTLRTRLAE